MKLCNICDTELTSVNFCPVCRRICRTPLFLNDGIYLNKPHHASEVNCEFHGELKRPAFINMRHPEHENACDYHKEKEPDKGGMITLT